MESNWKNVNLGNYAKITMGQSPESQFYNEELNGIPFLQGSKTFGDIFPKIEKYTTKTTKLASENSIIFSVRAPVGDVNIAPTELCIGRGLAALESRNNHFLYYLLKFNKFKYESYSSGTVFSSINKKSLETMIVRIPNEKNQDKIAEILWNLDSKIELNNQIISNLEELASTLFKRWFVDFEFPDENGNPYKSSGGKMVDSELGEIPESWEVNKIGNMDIVVSDHVANGSFKSLKENVKILEDKSYALFLRNVDLKAELRGTLRYIDKASYDFLKKTHLFGGEVIISNVGDVGTVHLVPKNDKKMVLGNNQIYLNSKIENMNTYLYLFFKSVKGQELIKSITSGSVQMKFNKTDFRNLKIVFPLLDNFNIFSELLGNIRVKKNENNILRDTRDSLLPKLLSGEIELPEDEEV